MSAANPKLFMGIDFGTTKSVMSRYDHRTRSAAIILNRERMQETPSVVYFGDNESENLIGVLAERRLGEATAAEQNRFVVSVKRFLQGPDDIPIRYIDGKNIYAVEVVTKILRRLKEDAELMHFRNLSDQPVSSVVITHPATFDEFQQAKIRRAAEEAGFREVVLLSEPVAAAIAYATMYEQMGAKVGNYILVYDFGGGTFDVAVLTRNSEGKFDPAIRPEGLIDCGGDDLDRELYNYCDEIAQKILTPSRHISLTNDLDLRFLHECRKRKENLSGENVTDETFSTYLPTADGGAMLFKHTVKRPVFEERIQKHVDRTVRLTQQVLQNARAKNCRIDTVVLIGGSSSVPLVLKSLSNSLPAEPIQLREWEQRDFAVALGAAYYGHMVLEVPPFVSYPPKDPPLIPPPPPVEELYRGTLERIWMPTRRLTRSQVSELAAQASQLRLSGEAAAAIERKMMGYTKEEILPLQHQADLRQYRTLLMQEAPKKSFSQVTVDYLAARAKVFELSIYETDTIERELLGGYTIRDWVAYVQPRSVVQVQKWRFTPVKIIPLLLLLVCASAINSGPPELLVVIVPAALLCLWWFLHKPRVKVAIPPPPIPPASQQR
jgi:hypothetical protein